jgi:hypothetical protein
MYGTHDGPRCSKVKDRTLRDAALIVLTEVETDQNPVSNRLLAGRAYPEPTSLRKLHRDARKIPWREENFNQSRKTLAGDKSLADQTDTEGLFRARFRMGRKPGPMEGFLQRFPRRV